MAVKAGLLPAEVAARIARSLRVQTSYAVPRGAVRSWAALLKHWVVAASRPVPEGQACALAYCAGLVLQRGLPTGQVRARIALAERGDWLGLLNSAVEHAKSVPRGARDRARLARVRMTYGDVSGACRVINGRTMRRTTPLEVETLFPRRQDAAPAPFRPPDDDWIAAAAPGWKSACRAKIEAAADREARDSAWDVAVLSALGGPCAAPGHDGLRGGHVRVATGVPSLELTARLGHLVELLTEGLMADPAFGDVVVHAVPKANGGIRPIGCGSVVRRTAARIANRSLTDALAPGLVSAGQFAAAPDGTRRVHLRLRQLVLRGYAVLRVDVANAFGTVERRPLLEAIDGCHAPGVKLARLLYSSDTRARHAVHPGEPFQMDRGVVQGCAFSALLFAATLAKAITGGLPDVRVAPPVGALEIPDDAYMASYADDMFFASKRVDDLAAIAARIPAAIGAIGLATADKSELLCGEGVAVPDALQLFVGGRVVPVMDVLGAPIAPPTPAGALAEHERVLARCAKAKELVRGFKRFQDPQYVLRALAIAGVWSRAEHVLSLAGERPDAELAALEEVEVEVLKEGALGPWAVDLDAAGWAIATLPPLLGGLGLRSPTAEGAHCAENTMTRVALVEAGDGEGLRTLKAKLQDQKSLRHGRVRQALYQVLSDTDVVRLYWAPVNRANLATDFIPSPYDSTLLSPAAGQARTALDLALPPLGKGVDLPCSHRCRTGEMVSSIGDSSERCRHHLMTCGGHFTTRHTGLLRAIHAHTSDLGEYRDSILAERDVCDLTGAPVPPDQRGARPGDLTYESAIGHIFVDVTVSMPFRAVEAQAALIRAGRVPQPLTDPPLVAMAVKDKAENAKRVRQAGSHFRAIGLSAYGGIPDRAMRHIREMAAAFEANAPVKTPVGQRSRAQRLASAMATAVRAEPARQLARLKATLPPEIADRQLRETSGALGGDDARSAAFLAALLALEAPTGTPPSVPHRGSGRWFGGHAPAAAPPPARERSQPQEGDDEEGWPEDDPPPPPAPRPAPSSPSLLLAPPHAAAACPPPALRPRQQSRPAMSPRGARGPGRGRAGAADQSARGLTAPALSIPAPIPPWLPAPPAVLGSAAAAVDMAALARALQAAPALRNAMAANTHPLGLPMSPPSRASRGPSAPTQPANNPSAGVDGTSAQPTSNLSTQAKASAKVEPASAPRPGNRGAAHSTLNRFRAGDQDAGPGASAAGALQQDGAGQKPAGAGASAAGDPPAKGPDGPLHLADGRGSEPQAGHGVDADTLNCPGSRDGQNSQRKDADAGGPTAS